MTLASLLTLLLLAAGNTAASDQPAPQRRPAPVATAQPPAAKARPVKPAPPHQKAEACGKGTPCLEERQQIAQRSQQTRANFCDNAGARLCGVCGEGTRCEPVGAGDSSTQTCACVGRSPGQP